MLSETIWAAVTKWLSDKSFSPLLVGVLSETEGQKRSIFRVVLAFSPLLVGVLSETFYPRWAYDS